MVRYDPKILQKYAELLYRDARFVVFVITLLFSLVGISVGVGFGNVIAAAFVQPAERGIWIFLSAAVGLIPFAVVGFLIGQAIAFWYRLKAQLTLCQRQIELNTRQAAYARQQSFPEIQP